MKLSQRAEYLSNLIRSQHRQSTIKKARYQILHALNSKCLHSLIQATPTSITAPQICLLQSLAEQDHPNAIVHLGNLIIDSAITPLQLAPLAIGKDAKWYWLCRVLAHFSYHTPSMLQFVLRAIHPQHYQQDDILQHAIATLVTIARNHPITDIIPRNCLTYLYECMLHPIDDVSLHAYKLIRVLQLKCSLNHIMRALLKGIKFKIQAVEIAIRFIGEDGDHTVAQRLLVLLKTEEKWKLKIKIISFMEIYVKQCPPYHLKTLAEQDLIEAIVEFGNYQGNTLNRGLLSCIKNRFYYQLPNYTPDLRKEYKRLNILREIEDYQQLG